MTSEDPFSSNNSVILPSLDYSCGWNPELGICVHVLCFLEHCDFYQWQIFFTIFEMVRPNPIGIDCLNW